MREREEIPEKETIVYGGARVGGGGDITKATTVELEKFKC